MNLYGLADYRLRAFGQIIEFFLYKEEADAALRDVLGDEPEWTGELGVVPVEFPMSPH